MTGIGTPPPSRPPIYAALDTPGLLNEVNVARLNHYHQDAALRIKAVTDLAILWLRTMTVLSGGAVIGLLTVLSGSRSQMLNQSATWVALSLFFVTLVLTMTALFLGYLGQDRYYTVERDTAENIYQDLTGGQRTYDVEDDQKHGTRFMVWGLIAAILALVSFSCAGAAGLVAALPREAASSSTTTPAAQE